MGLEKEQTQRKREREREEIRRGEERRGEGGWLVGIALLQQLKSAEKMSRSSGTSRGTEFYEKAYMAGLVHFVAGGMEEKGGHKENGAIAMLHLHESLATICVAQAKEVVACYIEAVAVPGQAAGGSTLHMGQNRTWLKPAQDYVARILKILAKMSTDNGTSSEEQLQKEVYTYCERKVLDRITKFEDAVEPLVKRKDDWAKNLLPQNRADEIGNFVKTVKSLGRLSLSAKSEAFRKTAAGWGASSGVLALLREKNYYTVEKRMLKVASYSRSIQVLSEWAKGAGEYKSLKKTYPVPATHSVIYSKPAKNTPIKPTSEWQAIATKYYPKDVKIDAIEELNKGIDRKDANKLETQKDLYQIHAEMHIVKDLLALARRALVRCT